MADSGWSERAIARLYLRPAAQGLCEWHERMDAREWPQPPVIPRSPYSVVT